MMRLRAAAERARTLSPPAADSLLAIVLSAAAAMSDLAFTAITTVAPWLAGRALRDRRLLAALMRDRALELERERDTVARLAVAEERARIAREVHDVIAHSVSLMVVQAGAAEDVLDRDHRRAREPL